MKKDLERRIHTSIRHRKSISFTLNKFNKLTFPYFFSQIATMPETGIPSHLIGEEENEYACVGDISEVIPLHFLTILHSYSLFFPPQIILLEDANIYRNPFILASGITDNFDSPNLTFTLTPSQYINLSRTILDCPISCYFDSESKKWKGKKPMPVTGTTISVTGMLTKIKRGFNRTITLEIELDNIAYLNRQTTTSTDPSHRMYTHNNPSHINPFFSLRIYLSNKTFTTEIQL